MYILDFRGLLYLSAYPTEVALPDVKTLDYFIKNQKQKFR